MYTNEGYRNLLVLWCDENVVLYSGDTPRILGRLLIYQYITTIHSTFLVTGRSSTLLHQEM
jgi:hypothetical protein